MNTLTRRLILVGIVGVILCAGYYWYESARTYTLVIADERTTLPPEIVLTRGIQDVLVVKNASPTSITVAGTTLAPGQQLRQYYRSVGEYTFTCSTHTDKTLRVVVRDP